MKHTGTFALAWILGFSAAFGAEENWPQFRGPDGNGHADSKNLPLTWSETNNVKWKTSLHGRSWSSPVVWGNQVWVTTATEDGREMFVICVDRDSGSILHDLKVFEVEKQTDIRRYNTYASPTPVIEAGRIYVTFGAVATGCIDTQTGKVLWARRDLKCNHYRGPGSSPVVSGDLLFMNFDGSDAQFIIALDKKTGETRWRRDRSLDYKDLGADGKPEAEGDWRKAFATPHVAVLDGVATLISLGAKATYGYNPRTGDELWRVEERTSHSGAARPLVNGNTVILNTGFSSGQILAMRPGKKGGVLDANIETPAGNTDGISLVWKSKRSVPRKPSLTLVDGLLYGVLDDGGLVSCLEAATGNEVWRERIGGKFSASPIAANGRIYLCAEDGRTTVLQAGRELKKLAENKLAGEMMASPAVAGDALYLRTTAALYRIGE